MIKYFVTIGVLICNLAFSANMQPVPVKTIGPVDKIFKLPKNPTRLDFLRFVDISQTPTKLVQTMGALFQSCVCINHAPNPDCLFFTVCGK